MKLKPFLIFFYFFCLAANIFYFLNNAQASSPDIIKIYKDNALTEEATFFSDGSKVYATVTNGALSGGSRNITVINNSSPQEKIVVEVSDNGLFYDKVANDGIYSGMFIITTKLTISPNNLPSPEDATNTTAYKVVKNIHINDKENALIESDFDGDGVKQSKMVGLITLFNVKAEAIKDTSARIFWNTSDSGYSKVEYGTTFSYGLIAVKEVSVKDLKIAHEVELTGLLPNTTYYYRVSTKDTYGNYRVSDNYNFITLSTNALNNAIKAARVSKDLPKTYYVKTDGSDLNDGLTIATAWQHPSYAVQKADAGDMINLIAGTWYDEHLVFVRSGIDIAPITLTTYNNGISILDGLDKIGAGVKLTDKSYINISGLHLKNYNNGFYFQNKINYINASSFILENINKEGVTFYSVEPLRRISFFDFEAYTIGANSGYSTISYGGARDFSDIEIYDFNIHDISGSGIYWRSVDRLHINDGIIKTIGGSDGVSFSLNTYNSIMENLKIDNAQWHGVAVHDWTVGMNPAYNNIIRNCEISNVSHNHIDLHSGAYNTLVENNIIHGQLTYSNGIYFHNRGAGLIARNNTFYNSSGFVNSSGYPQFPISDMIIENNTMYDCIQSTSSCVSIGSNNVKFFGNSISNLPASGTTIAFSGSNIIMEDNNIEEGKTYRIDVGTNNVIRNPKESNYYIKNAYGGGLTLEYTNGKVYKQEFSGGSGQYTIASPVITPEKSYSMIGSDATGYVYAKITPYAMTAVPSAGSITINVSKFDTSLVLGNILVNFTVNSTSSNNVVFTVRTLKPLAKYLIKKGVVDYATVQADSAGKIIFSDLISSQDKFTIEETLGGALAVSAPVFFPAAGIYSSAQSIGISSVTSGTIIHYTTNGSDPTESSPIYSAPIAVSSNIVLKAGAWKSGFTPSAITSASYNIGVSVLTSVSISPAVVSVVEAGTQNFTAQFKDQFGNPVPSIATWSSSNKSIGTINSAGVFTAIAAGAVSIIATNGLISGSVNVIVTPKVKEFVAHWNFDEGTGTAFNDSSGSGNNGVISGASWVDGKIGKALSFDGIDDFVNINKDLVNNSMTIELWLKPVNVIYSQRIIHNGNGGGWGPGPEINLQIDGATQKIVFSGSSNVSANTFFVGTPITAEWTHIAVVLEGTTMKLYKNGSLAASSIWMGSFNKGTYNFNNSTISGRSDKRYAGFIDEVKIYSRGLSASEVLAEFNAGNNSTPNLSLMADLNSDSKVNSLDFGIMMSAWGSAAKPKADINQDGMVNSIDFGIMMSAWGM